MGVKLVSLLFCVMLSLMFTGGFDVAAHALSRTIFVPTDFSTIQEAINYAASGDKIFVLEGMYQENVVVNKSVSILGQNKNTTIIDGGGVGVVVRINAENVSVSGFTVQNSGAEAYECGIFVESNFSNISGNIIIKNGLWGIYLNNSFGSQLFENIIMDNGGDGIFLIYSSNNVLFDNLLARNNGGIRLYSSNHNNVSENIVTHDLLGGIYLFCSSNNSLFGNVASYSKSYGLILDYSSDKNMIVDNSIAENYKYGLVLGSVSGNILRNNNMSDNLFNFHAVLARANIEDYLNDIDPSNIVDGKEIHYVINKENLTINSTSHPNIGYLALVNSTRINVEGLSFSGNGQALLLAFTSNSTLENLNVSNNNNGIQLCSSNYINITNCTIINNSEDGITLDHSSLNNAVESNIIDGNKKGLRAVHSCANNIISKNGIRNNDIGMHIYSYSGDNIVTDNIIVSNHIGVSIQRVSPTRLVGNVIANNELGLLLETSGNVIFHNNFVNNTIQVTTSNSTSIWDLGYSCGGNYWIDYDGEDANDDGIGDVPYIIDEYNVDRYPLTSLWTEEDEKPPAIGFPTRSPSNDVQPNEEVAVYVTVTDVGSGLKNVTLFYTINDGASWVELNMTYNSTDELFMAVLPSQQPGILVKYEIVAFDNAGNVAVEDNSGQFFTYEVIPEFSSIYLLLSFLTTTVIVLFIVKVFSRKKQVLRDVK